MSSEPADLSEHYKTVVRGLTLGRLTLVLGAGANLISRPPETPWAPGGDYLPSGVELAEYLAEVFNYDGNPDDLLRVSQYVSVIRGGTGPLYDELHQIFDHDYAPTQLHDFIAALPATLEARGQLLRGPPLILTTNYDDLLEQAFEAAGVPYDVVIYIADGKDAGKFRHQPSGDGETPQLIKEPETYIQLDPRQRTVVLKIHGFVDRGHPDPEDASDSYVITEDHYIEYLSRTDLDSLVPVKLLRRLRKCHFLFLGYSMRDWNLRAILHQIWADREQDYDSWSVQIHADPLETKSWERREVQIFDMQLTQYLTGLHEYLAADAPKTGLRA